MYGGAASLFDQDVPLLRGYRGIISSDIYV